MTNKRRRWLRNYFYTDKVELPAGWTASDSVDLLGLLRNTKYHLLPAWYPRNCRRVVVVVVVVVFVVVIVVVVVVAVVVVVVVVVIFTRSRKVNIHDCA